jgi:hypothetical protein
MRGSFGLKAVEEYVRVGGDEESWRLDLRALAVDLDRTLTPAGDPASVETRRSGSQRPSTPLGRRAARSPRPCSSGSTSWGVTDFTFTHTAHAEGAGLGRSLRGPRRPLERRSI